MSAPTVSIAIPSYNHARFLERAIESVLAQDYPHIELIVIDDGSTDESRGILERYGSRFDWEVQTNAGQAATLNKAWARSRGDILSYLSADDRLLPHAVSTAVRELERRADVAMVYGDFDLVDEHGTRMRGVRAPEFSYFDMVVRTVCAPGPGVFFRRSAYSLAGGWNSAFRQWPDYDYWLRLGLAGPFLRVPEVLAEFRVHEASQTFSALPFDRAEEPIHVLREFYDGQHTLPAAVAAAKPRALSNAYVASAQLHFRGGRPRVALARLRFAARLYWRNVASPRTARLVLHGLLSRPVQKMRMKVLARRAGS